MIRRLPLLLLVVLSVPSCRPAPRAGGESRAAAGFDCQPTGELVTVHLLPRPFGGVDRCVPDPAGPANPSLLCLERPGLARWKMESLCQGKYTVKIEGDAFKANITAPAPCHLEKEYEKGVNDDDEMVCSLPTEGKFGYRIEVCLADGGCARTDPGIWVNRGATLAEYQKAEAEARVITYSGPKDLEEPKPTPPPETK